MAEQQSKPFSVTNITKLSKRHSLSTIQRTKRNKLRRLRRKRSKLRYLQHLKKVRVRRFSRELCESLEVFNLTNMECAASFEPAIKDVAEWQNLHQLAYWKSRAVSLEYENRMLHQHIKSLYAKQIEGGNELEECVEESAVEEEAVEEVDESKMAPTEQAGKARREEMDKLYGKMAPKIMGMETAVQLSYDYQVEKCNPAYWPNVPLKL